MLKKLLLFILLIATPAQAETMIIPIRDLLIEIPNYEAPRLNLGSSLNGRYEITDIKKSLRSNKELRAKILDLAHELHPEAKSIRIFNNSLIIKF